jgi:phosphatidylglycerol---prolipoprotein diacylglyceryl transferase
MYPNLFYALQSAFGIEWHWTKIFNTFGLLLAFAFLCAAVVLFVEFKRKRQQGLLTPTQEKYIVGEKASIAELIVQAIVGFLIGFKFLGGLIDGGLANDAQAYIASKQGNIFAGLAVGGLFTYLKWREKDKEKLDIPITKIREIWPQDRVGDITIIAAITGLIGAKIFHFLENWDAFVKAPMEFITAFGGLTFYGGLILAAVAIFWYAHTKKINWKHLVDTCAPALMIAYAVGRLGCQISGDGDWGVYNSAYISTPDGKVVLADAKNNLDSASKNDATIAQYFQRDIKQFGSIPHKSYVAPSFIPTWLVAMNYTHNVNEEGVALANTKPNEKFNTMLPVPVYPTPIYEFIICTILFLVLWFLRKKITTPGYIFGIYLMMNGAERFLVEKIRVNTQYHFLGLHPSQAEIISTILFITGIGIILYCKKTTSKNLVNS